jgi:hypothetical protein
VKFLCDEGLQRHAMELPTDDTADASSRRERYLSPGSPQPTSDRVRTVWLADTPEDPPRLITAYPAPRGG